MVPFLVLLPIVENSDMTTSNASDLISQLGPTAVTTVGSLGLLLLAGRTVLRRVFQARQHRSIATALQLVVQSYVDRIVMTETCFHWIALLL